MLVLRLQHVSSRFSGFPVASMCLWGELQNLSWSKVSKAVLMSFCVAGMALRDIHTCLSGSRSTLDMSIFMLRGRRTLDVSCCVFVANRIVRAVSGGDNCHFVRQAQYLVKIHRM